MADSTYWGVSASQMLTLSTFKLALHGHYGHFLYVFTQFEFLQAVILLLSRQMIFLTRDHFSVYQNRLKADTHIQCRLFTMKMHLSPAILMQPCCGSEGLMYL